MTEQVVPVLRADDAQRAVAWYERLGFTKTDEHRFEPGFPAFVTIDRGEIRLFLSEHTGDARPDTLVYMFVEDVDAIARELAALRDAWRAGALDGTPLSPEWRERLSRRARAEELAELVRSLP